MSNIHDAFLAAYNSALEHSHNNKRCSHLGCSLLINGEISIVSSNSKAMHAEMHCLDLLLASIDNYWEKVAYVEYRSGPCEDNQGWNKANLNVEAVF